MKVEQGKLVSGLLIIGILPSLDKKLYTNAVKYSSPPL